MVLVIFGTVILIAGVSQFAMRRSWARQAAALSDTANIWFLKNRTQEFWVRVSVPFVVTLVLAGGSFVLVGILSFSA